MLMAQEQNQPNAETPEERARLLGTLTETERSVVEDILRDNPLLTVAACIEHCRAMGL